MREREVPDERPEGLPRRVIVLAGPSGAGKSRLAERTGLPVLRLDDYYKDGDDPSLPHIEGGTIAGMVDWDHPASWLPDDAMAALETLCRHGEVLVPMYDIARNARHGHHRLALRGARFVIAEGIFAAEIVPQCSERGLLAAAYCVRQHPVVTFWRRLTRDLREHRKPPLVLVRRGLALLRGQRRVVEHAASLGARPVTPEQAFAGIAALQDGRALLP